MQRDQLTAIGTIRRTHGVQGALKFEFDPFYADDLFGQQAIILETGGSYLPFFIETMEETHQGKGILKLEDISNKEDAAHLNGKDILLKTKTLTMLKEDELAKYTGLTVTDKSKGELGIVEEVLEMPQQLMLKVIREDSEILIPLHDDFILETNFPKKTILLSLPEGFLDIFNRS